MRKSITAASRRAPIAGAIMAGVLLAAGIAEAQTAFVPTAGGAYPIAKIDASAGTLIASFTGISGIRHIQVSPDGGRLFASGDNVRVYDTTTGALVGAPFGGNGTRGVVTSPDGNLVYVVNNTSQRLETYSLTGGVWTENTSRRVANVGTNPTDAVITPDGTKVYILDTAGSKIWLTDPTAAVPAKTDVTPVLPNGYFLFRVAMAPDGQTLWALALNNNSGGRIIGIDTATGTARSQNFVTALGFFTSISVTQDNDSLILGDINGVISRIAGVSNLATATTTTVAPGDCTGMIDGVSASPTSNRVVVACNSANRIYILRSTDLVAINSIAYGGQPSFSGSVFPQVAAAVQPGNPTPVPTMTEWAMILFGTILAGGAALYIQRRRVIA